MECPNCKLISPAEAMRCDCGYDFVAGKIESSYLKEKAETSSRWRRDYWPVIYDSESARKAGKAGTMAAFFVASCTVLFAFLSIFNISNLTDASALEDAAIFEFLVFIIRKAREAAASSYEAAEQDRQLCVGFKKSGCPPKAAEVPCEWRTLDGTCLSAPSGPNLPNYGKGGATAGLSTEDLRRAEAGGH